MPTIQAAGYAVPRGQTVEPLDVAPAAYQNIPTSADMFGGAIGTALSRLSQQTESASDAWTRIGAEFDKTAAQEAMNNVQTRYNNRMFGDPNVPGDLGFRGKEGKDAMEARQQVWNDTRADLNAAAAGLQNDQQRRQFDQHARNLLLHAQREIGEHTRTQFGKYQDDTDKAAVQLAGSRVAQAAISGDSAAFNTALGEQAVIIDRFGRRNGWSPEQIQAEKNKLSQDAVIARVHGYGVRGDHQGALDFLTANAEHFTDPNKLEDLKKEYTTKRDNGAAADKANQYFGSPASPGPQTTTGGAPRHLNYGGTGALGDPRSPGWEATNITTVQSPSGAKFRVHKEAAQDFSNFMKDLEETGYQIKPGESGGHVVRNIRGGNTLSEHAYGTAIDINWNDNLYTKDGRKVTNLPPSVAALAEKHNLEWGGNWTDPVDTMHFQWRGPRGGTGTATADNNLGGIRQPGPPRSKAEGGFMSYPTPEAGVQAIAANLGRYAAGGVLTANNPEGKPLNTIRDIVSVWAPSNENDTNALIDRASQTTGYKPDEVLDLKNPEVMGKMVEAIIRNEQGGRLPVSRDLITKAVSGGSPAPSAGGDTSAPRASPRRPIPDLDKIITDIYNDSSLSPEAREKAISMVTNRYHHLLSATAVERKELKSQLEDGVAALTAGKDWTPPSDDTLYRVLPPADAAEVKQKITQAQEFGRLRNSVQFASPEEIDAKTIQIDQGLRDTRTPGFAQRQKLAHAFKTIVKEREEALKDDPAQFASQSPAVQAAYDAQKANPTPENVQTAVRANLAEQERLGVRHPEQQRVLTKQQATDLVSKIANMDPEKTDYGPVLDGYNQLYGDQYWNQAFGQLVHAGLPDTVQILGTLSQPDQAAFRTDFERMVKFTIQKGGAEKLKQAAGTAGKDVDAELERQLAEFRNTVQGDVKLYTTVHNAVRDLAYYYALQSNDGGAAVKKAYEGILGRKYDFTDTYRAPKGTLGTVDVAANEQLAQLTPAGVPDPGGGDPRQTAEYRQKAEYDAIMRGRWVNTTGDDGIRRMAIRRDGSVVPARRADGSFIEFKFSEAPGIAAMAATRPPPVLTTDPMSGMPLVAPR